MINFIKNNTFVFAILTCLLFFMSAGMFFGGHYFNVQCVSFAIVTIIILSIQKNFIDSIIILWISLLSLVLYFTILEYNSLLLFVEIMFVIWLAVKHKESTFFISSAIISISFLLHLYFILNTKVDFLQHDLSGITTYISKISEKGLNWRYFNPWYMYYMFHQPLNFIIQKQFLSLSLSLWGTSLIAFEGLQYLSLFYVSATTILIARILKTFKLSKKIYFALLILVCFNPTLFLFSGYISNDVAVLFWEIFVLYYLILWHKKGLTKYVLYTAIGFGLGTLSKLSMLLYVPSISVVFLFKLLKSKNKGKIIKDISLFIIVAVPISLLWIIRNHILFDMQFYNIPDTSPEGQNFYNLSLLERITDFSMLFSPFINAPHISDANMFLAIIKTELFGEWDFRLFNKYTEAPSMIIYIINITIKIASLVGFIKLALNKKTYSNIYAILFTSIWIFTWGYMIKYTMDLPYVCSSDYRLFTSILLSESFIIGNLISKNKTAQYVLLAVSIVYAIMSSLIYIAIS